MKELKRLGGQVLSLYAKIDPLVFQKRYASRSLREKARTIIIDSVERNTQERIKDMWGRVSPWHSFYYTIGIRDVSHLYFPDDIFYSKVDATLNDWKKAPVVDDKNLYDLLFFDAPHPHVIARKIGDFFEDGDYNIITIDDAIRLCENIGEVIIKVPYESSGGHGIRFWKRNCDESIREILTSSGSMVIQALIKQHEELSKLHRDSINTIRIMTMTDKNFVLPLSSIVRMGVGGVNG